MHFNRFLESRALKAAFEDLSFSLTVSFISAREHFVCFSNRTFEEGFSRKGVQVRTLPFGRVRKMFF